MKRKNLSNRIRFEVFKRDSFTCQYCGSKAPEVVLQVDHIVPVSKGGSDDLLNLVTSCKTCNSGKSDREISDESAVSKAKAQADLLNERKVQIELMAEWYAELDGLKDKEIDMIEGIIYRATGYTLSEFGRSSIAKRIKKHGVRAVADNASEVFGGASDDITSDDFGSLIKKLDRSLKFKDVPFHLQKSAYLTGVARNRWKSHWNWYPAFKAITALILEEFPEEYSAIYSILADTKDIDKARDKVLDLAESLDMDEDSVYGAWNDA